MSGSAGGARRSTYQGMPMAYAAVGASAAPDLLRFPPEGSTPFEETLRLGSGQDRFLIASALLMTWGAHRGAGHEVSDVVAGDGGQYTGIVFDGTGQPEQAPGDEHHFGPDGEPYLTAGTTATITAAKGQPRAVIVIHTVDEPNRVGFAIGSADAEGAVGEQQFTVEMRDDGSVWATVRGFLTAPANGLLGIKGKNHIKTAIADANDQLRSLMPGAVIDAARAPGASAGEMQSGTEAEIETASEGGQRSAEPERAGDDGAEPVDHAAAEPVEGQAAAEPVEDRAPADAAEPTGGAGSAPGPERVRVHQRRPSRR